MKVTAIELTHFRSGTDLSLGTNAPRVFVVGRNGSGKSSLRECVRWVLTGRCDQTDGKGAGAEKLAPFGGDGTVEASLTLEGIGTVRRRKTASGTVLTVQGFTGDSTAQQAALYQKLGTTPEYLQAVLSTEYFLDLHHADAKALVMGLLNVTVEIDGQPRTLDELDALHKEAFDARKVKKAQHRELSLAVPPAPSGDPMPPIADVEALLTKRRGQLQDVIGKSGESSGRRKALEQELARAQAYQPYRADLTAAQVREEISVLEEKEGLLQTPARAPLAVVPRSGPGPSQVDVAVYRSLAETLANHQPKRGCVLDPEVPCETSKHKFNHRVKALQDLIQSAEPSTPAPAKPKGPTRDEQLAQTRRELTRLRAIQARYAESEVVAKDKAADITRITAELENLGATATGEEGEAEALRAAVSKGEMFLQKTRDWHSAVQKRADALVARDRVGKEAEALEARVELLGPSGARLEALQKAIWTLEQQINTFLVTFAQPMAVRFTMDPWGVTVNDRPVETYSESEQFRIGIALQLALAEVSGLSFAVVDRLDMLDLGFRRQAQQMLVSAPTGQILILATREPEQALPANSEGLICYRLEQSHGRTHVVSAPVEKAS